MERIDGALLTALGVLVVHQVAYSTTSLLGQSSAVAHGHLAAAWLVSSAAALIGLAVAVTRSLRHRAHTPAAPWLSVAWIAGGYTAMEGVERLIDGANPVTLVLEPVFWLGLAATPVVALLLRRAVRSVEILAIRLSSPPSGAGWTTPTVPDFRSTGVELLPVLLSSFTVSRRGPPVGVST